MKTDRFYRTRLTFLRLWHSGGRRAVMLFMSDTLFGGLAEFQSVRTHETVLPWSNKLIDVSEKERAVMTPEELLNEARKVVGEFRLSKESLTAGSVGAALVTKSQKVYTGICIDLACGIGFCAEHSAIAEMLKDRETEIEMIVTVSMEKILPPCGRCREMMYQINKENKNTKVVVDQNSVIKLYDLLPYRFK